jgi:hypothetical protein
MALLYISLDKKYLFPLLPLPNEIHEIRHNKSLATGKGEYF